MVSLLVAGPAFAGPPVALTVVRDSGLRFEHLGMDDGLSQGNVEAVLQDRRGFMWFGTAVGLDRFDGYTTRTYRNDPDDPRSLLGAAVHDILEDAEGTLWVGTNQGLNRFDRSSESFARYGPDGHQAGSISGRDVWRLLEDRQGRFWVLTTDGGLNLLDRARGSFISYRHAPDDPRSLSGDEGRALYEDRAGNIWVGTNAGLDRFDPSGGGGFVHYGNDPTDPDGLAGRSVWAITEDRRGILWIGTSASGIRSLDPATGRFTRYTTTHEAGATLSAGFVIGFNEDAQGTLWVSTYGGGLFALDPTRRRARHFVPNPSDPASLGHNQLTALTRDRQGALWIATWGNGVDRLDPHAQKFKTYRHDPDNPASLGSGTVWTMYEDRGENLWVGTEGGGLSRLDRTRREFQHYRSHPRDPQSLTSDSVYAVYEDRRGVFWIGTRNGLNRLDPKTGKVTRRYVHDPADPHSLSSNDVRGICEAPDGKLWVANTGGGLDAFDPHTGRFDAYRHDPRNPDSLSGGLIYSMRCEPTGVMWLGLWRGGLDRFDPRTRTFRHYRHDPRNPASLADDDVWSVVRSSTGQLWIGTGGGLSRFDERTGRFTTYRRKDGLASDHIYSVAEDARGRLWLGTADSGLIVFDPTTGASRNYDSSDGLLSNQCISGSVLRLRRGALLFGAVNGFSQVEPDTITHNAFVPPVVLTSFAIFNRSVSVKERNSPLRRAIDDTDHVDLAHNQSVFSIEFAALNYRFPAKNRYAYRLDGFDSGWSHVDSRRRFATYTNLAPGTYTFRVKGSNNDGVWNEAERVLRITIAPPWWRTLWFRGLMVVLGLGLAGAGLRLRVRAVESHNRQLREEVARRTSDLAVSNEHLRLAKDAAEAASRAKSAFLANVSHELRTPLNLIIGFSALMRREAAAGLAVLSSAQRESLDVIHHGGEHLLALINDVLDLSKIEAGRATYNPGECDLHELIQELRELFGRLAAEKRLALHAQWDPQTPQRVFTDAAKLRQVLINLLGNAVKFTASGGVVLAVTRMDASGTLEGTRCRLRFSVADSGPGIHPQDRDRLFQAFTQADAGLKAREGTGLGLAISSQLVKLLGGELSVESRPGEGSRFAFEVSMEAIGSATPGIAHSSRTILGLSPSQPTRRILVADDQLWNRLLLVRLLESVGFVTDEAGDGEETLRRWREHHPDLIWLDMRMPKLSGHEVVRRIRAEEPSRRTKVLALTASAFEDERAHVLAAGCDDFLRKPFRETELLEMMARHLDLRYSYAGEAHPATLASPAALTGLRALPEEWLEEMRDALVLLDVARIDSLITRATAPAPELGAQLARYARELRYDTLLRALDDAAATPMPDGSGDSESLHDA